MDIFQPLQAGVRNPKDTTIPEPREIEKPRHRTGRTIRRVLISLSLLSFLSLASLNAQNLIANPGFESGLAPWAVSSAVYLNTAVYFPDSTVHHSGAFSLKGIETNPDSLGRAYQDVTSKVTVGKTYVLSGWIKTQNVVTDNNPSSPNYGPGGSFVFGIGYEGPYICCVAPALVEIGHVAGTQDWTFFQSAPFTVPPMPSGAVMLAVYTDFNASSGTAWIDDVQLIQSCDITAGPCITSPNDGASPQSQFAAISGTGTPRDTLNVLVGGFSVGQVQVDSEGNWEALPYVSPFGSSVTVQVQDQTTSNSSNTITVHPSLAFFPSPLPASYYARLLPLRKADIFIDGDISSPQVTLYGATYTHTALYLGGDSDGTPWLAEAVTAQEAGIWGQVRSVLLEQSLVWKANRVSAWRPFSPLSAATRSAIVNWASTITTQGLPYWSKAEIVGLPAAADTMYLAALPARLNLFLNAIYALTNSTSTFICSTLVWRAYYEGTGHALDISQPNLMTAQPGSLLGTFSPGFISLLSHAPVGCTGWCGSVFMVPETFVRSGKLSQIF